MEPNFEYHGNGSTELMKPPSAGDLVSCINKNSRSTDFSHQTIRSGLVLIHQPRSISPQLARQTDQKKARTFTIHARGNASRPNRVQMSRFVKTEFFHLNAAQVENKCESRSEQHVVTSIVTSARRSWPISVQTQSVGAGKLHIQPGQHLR